jgi:TRAP-type C4-dicarboxylate transport system permease large subunit
MLDPGWIFVVCLLLLVVGTSALQLPLAISLVITAAAGALLAGFANPLRHLLEGGFGYLNLILSLFVGALFGQAARASGAADAVAGSLHRLLRSSVPAITLVAGALLFLVGMFAGIAGVAVLAVGSFVIPMLRGIGMRDARIAAFIAVIATCGMIAPPVNVPAMTIADGVNMPFADFAGPLLLLSLPPALFAAGYYLPRKPIAAMPEVVARKPLWAGASALVAVLGFWTLLRIFPLHVPDPSAPIVLLIGALIVLPTIPLTQWSKLFRSAFGGAPLELGAILVAIGVAVQIMALTGVRGWLVINSLSLPHPWILLGLIGLPILGSVLTSIGTANMLGVPFAFAFIHQDMIVNVSALSALSALAEFMPPTAISAVLAAYLVGTVKLWEVLRASMAPVFVLAIVAVLMLMFARELAPYIVLRSSG